MKNTSEGLDTTDWPGLSVMVSIGRHGGFYISKGWSFRICLGFLSITFFPIDGDGILTAAAANDD